MARPRDAGMTPEGGREDEKRRQKLQSPERTRDIEGTRNHGGFSLWRNNVIG